MIHHISSEHLTLDKVKEIIDSHARLVLSEESIQAIEKCRRYLDTKMDDSFPSCSTTSLYRMPAVPARLCARK